MADTGRKQNDRPEIQNLPGTPTSKLEMRMAGMIHHSNDNPPSMGEEYESPLQGLIIEFARSEFTVPVNIQQAFNPYFLRMWKGDYVYSQVHDGIIEVAGNEYIVHWQSTPEVVRNSEKVACSFRGYKDKKYVVIKVWKSTESTKEAGE